MELAVLLLMLSPAYFFSTAGEWVFENQLGSAYQMDSRVVIEQDNQPDIKVTARWNTKSFEMPPYWSMRTGVWNGKTGYELELIHLKIFMKNLPAEVQRFSVSHGQNYMLLNRVYDREKFRWRWGAGLTISHPEITVRNIVTSEKGGLLNQGYQVSGLAAQASIQSLLPTEPLLGAFFSRVYLSGEAKLIGSYSWLRLEQGSAKLPLIGGHLLFGLHIRL